MGGTIIDHDHTISFESKPVLKKIPGCEGRYGNFHELIGKPCLHKIMGGPAIVIPYGAYIVDGEGYDDEVMLVVSYIENGLVRRLSAVNEEDLIPIDPNNHHALKIFHMVVSGSYDYEVERLKRENEKLKEILKVKEVILDSVGD